MTSPVIRTVWATPNGDALLAEIARVSNPSNEKNERTAAKLISYMIRHKHWSPFEMVCMCMEIPTTRDIARQILRHRSFAFQEFSQRYADVDALPEAPLREARLRHPTNRQASVPCKDAHLASMWAEEQENIKGAAHASYLWAIRNGIAKEVARAVLPEGLTPSRLYMTGSVRSWLHYCSLRMGEETQIEHRAIAAACWEQLRQAFPVTVEAWEASA